MFRRNMGTIDRIARAGLGVALVAIGLGVVGGTTGVAIAAVAALPFATALLGSCPLYTALGLSTCPTPQQRHG